ncbi:thioredoxin family protein [Candidatus Woesearchaeota archaeon]|nr:thioredoxin family protein [Candidatus Woesearchaeota archaeon]
MNCTNRLTMNKATISTLVFCLALGSAEIIGAGAACSGANSSGYFSSLGDRPAKPEFISHKPYVLEIKTNGYDINLESYLRQDRTTVVEFGAWWCGPCIAFKHRAVNLNAWPSDLDLIMVDLDYRLPDGESIQSPAGRYVDKNGGKTLPCFLLYKGKQFGKALPFEGQGLDYILNEARRL